LDTDAKLAVFYFVYEESDPLPQLLLLLSLELAPRLLGDYYELSDDQQLAIMEIVNREDTDYSRAYGAIKKTIN